MRYLGGKVRLAKELAAKIVEYIPFGGTYGKKNTPATRGQGIRKRGRAALMYSLNCEVTRIV